MPSRCLFKAKQQMDVIGHDDPGIQMNTIVFVRQIFDGILHFCANIRQSDLRAGTAARPYNMTKDALFALRADGDKVCAVLAVIVSRQSERFSLRECHT